jgi:hypothetical protein
MAISIPMRLVQIDLALSLPSFKQFFIGLGSFCQSGQKITATRWACSGAKKTKYASNREVMQRNVSHTSRDEKHDKGPSNFDDESHDVLSVVLLLIPVCQNFLNMTSFICCFLAIRAFFHRVSQSFVDWVNRPTFHFSTVF